jgi:hypothetical protein
MLRKSGLFAKPFLRFSRLKIEYSVVFRPPCHQSGHVLRHVEFIKADRLSDDNELCSDNNHWFWMENGNALKVLP